MHSTTITQPCFYTSLTYMHTGPPSLAVNIAKNIESSSIVVQWDVNDSLITTYTVTWTETRVEDGLQVVTLTEQTSYAIIGLTLDTVYTITSVVRDQNIEIVLYYQKIPLLLLPA